MPAVWLLPGGHGDHNRADQGVTPPTSVTPQAVAAAGADGGLVHAVLLGVDDGVVTADAVGLERLGGWVVVPAATLGEVAERESAPGR